MIRHSLPALPQRRVLRYDRRRGNRTGCRSTPPSRSIAGRECYRFDTASAFSARHRSARTGGFSAPVPQYQRPVPWRVNGVLRYGLPCGRNVRWEQSCQARWLTRLCRKPPQRPGWANRSALAALADFCRNAVSSEFQVAADRRIAD
jgi:hypothetical protein